MGSSISKLSSMLAQSKCNVAFIEVLLSREILRVAEENNDSTEIEFLQNTVDSSERNYRDMCRNAGVTCHIDEPMREFSVRERLPDGDGRWTWIEVALGNCGFGCKIYENNKTGERVLAHNSAYGCSK